MPAWLAALVAALWEFIRPYLPPIGAAIAGAKLQEGQQNAEILEAVDEAAKRVAELRARPHADKLRYLQKRGLHRVSK